MNTMQQAPSAEIVEKPTQEINPTTSGAVTPEEQAVKNLLADEKFLVIKDDEHVKLYEAYQRKEEDKKGIEDGVETQETLEAVRERESRIKEAAEADISKIFSARNEQSRDRDSSGKKIDLVKAVIKLFKNSTMGEGQSVVDWQKYQAAVMEKASMISNPSERQALEALVDNQGNGALNALARGPITAEERSSAEKRLIVSGISEEDAHKRLDNLESSRNSALEDAKKILDTIDPDLSYNL